MQNCALDILQSNQSKAMNFVGCQMDDSAEFSGSEVNYIKA